jgi:hypothetical protein
MIPLAILGIPPAAAWVGSDVWHVRMWKRSLVDDLLGLR